MKILHTADWHLGAPRSPIKNGINLRTEDTKRCLNELVRVAKEEQPDYTLVSGDIFDVGQLQSDRCCKEIITAVHYIKELAEVSGQVLIMRGTPNHDGIGQFNVLAEMFFSCPNVHIITEPKTFAFHDVNIAVLPGFDSGIYRTKFPELSKEEENAAITNELANIIIGMRAQCRPDKKSILMAHYTVPGCNTESGQTMLMAQFEPVIAQETLLAADYDLVALGHIHRPQRVTENPWYYSGAVNAMNFNDEGQERGFWIHSEMPFGGWDSRFHRTPAREFITFHFTDTDVAAVNLGQIDEVALNYWRLNGAVQDKIVRIFYTCTAENEKTYKMNGALLEKTLLNDGAFMLWENLSERIEGPVNRKELANTTDPEINLIRYFEEKQEAPEKVQELLRKARPIIAQAQANTPFSSDNGIFEPIEISVKNYRNYVDETFNFEDIRFCTINGPNGAGKSSLFMDAIVDCLYEEPREGVIKDSSGKSPWLNNDEKVHSGSIMFTFRIGRKKYRVTRTRTRSGKGTLNIAECVNGAWMDCSRERYNDTQQVIEDIIGMDSFTFKSCALIMQDQYGLFLQAKPEERVEVLGTLLGLGVYQDMERIASDQAKEFGQKSQKLEHEIEIHSHTMDSLEYSSESLEFCKEELSMHETELKIRSAERDASKKLLDNRETAVERRKKLLSEISALQGKKLNAEQNKAVQQSIIDSCMLILNSRQEIEEKIAEYHAQTEKEKQLAGESALYASKKAEAKELKQQTEEEQRTIDRMKEQAEQTEKELEALQPTDQDIIIRKNAEEYERKKKMLDEAYEKDRSYLAAEQVLTNKKHLLQQISMQYEADVRNMRTAEAEYQKKAELLKNVECVDIENARCGFLADALEAKQTLSVYPQRYSERKKAYEEKISPVNGEIAEIEKKLTEMHHDPDAVVQLEKEVSELKPYVVKLEALNQRKSRIALIKASQEHLRSNIQEAEKRLSEAGLKASAAELERDKYAEASREYALIQESLFLLKPWLEKEKQLSVAEERKTTALKRMAELAEELSGIDTDIADKQEEVRQEGLVIDGTEELAGIVSELNVKIDRINTQIKEKQKTLGSLEQKKEQAEKLGQEIKKLREKQVEYASESAGYETLKTAFGQSGVPHQIIRSIIPNLTDTANAILGQMTGGKMGVEFRLERVQKKREKGSLDIFVEEYGISSLPYLSRSGGEKVKSSLAVILALAEIKSSSAGIQLGMLFIDEPPFLDNDGVSAYCDALEAIQDRYKNIKIMAITHDPNMKARFPQNLDVVKTENGSRVVY